MATIDSLLHRYLDNESRTGSFTGYSTEPVTRAAALLGNPQNAYATVLITGTNGKGTVATFLHALLRAAGLRCGLYTSPHLLRVNERIIVENPVPDNEGAAIIEYIEERSHGIQLTWFDMMTLTAFEYFKRMHVDIAVCETGLGGRLDSTTIADPYLSIITDISLDHTHILGRTVREIATDKSALIRKNTPVISSSDDPAVQMIITERAQKQHSTKYQYKEAYQVDSYDEKTGSFTYTDLDVTIPDIVIPNGHFATAKNAASAIQALFLSGAACTAETIRETLRTLRIPGRFEQLSTQPPVYYDVAHNAASLHALLQTITSHFHTMPVRLCVALMCDKQPETLMQILCNTDHEILYCILPDERAYKPESAHLHTVSLDNTAAVAQQISDGKPTVFTGTFRMYPYMADIIKKCEEGYGAHGF